MAIGYDSGYERTVYKICKLNKKSKFCKKLSKFLMALTRIIWPCDIDANATIKEGLSIPHAVGIVVGYTSIIDENVTIMSGVVIGGAYNHHRIRGHAHIERGVLLGANSVILGPITVGEYAKVGANAVITKDVPPYTTVVGNNKIIRIAEPKESVLKVNEGMVKDI